MMQCDAFGDLNELRNVPLLKILQWGWPTTIFHYF